jgi:hypothetical protein
MRHAGRERFDVTIVTSGRRLTAALWIMRVRRRPAGSGRSKDAGGNVDR